MAAGVPAVVARAASLSEVCGDAAIYFNPLQVEDIAEKLVIIAFDATLRQQLKQKGLNRSRTFTWAECSEKTAAALRANLGPEN